MTTSGGAGAAVEQLDVRVYTVPTDEPEADGTLAWDSTTMVLVRAVADDLTGIGYTYSSRAARTVVTDVLAKVVVGRPVSDVAGAADAMARAVRNLGRPGIAASAISAVDTALWDLKAKTLGVALADLIGRVRHEVPLYGSGGFTTYDEERLRSQLGGWVRDDGIPRVKIKIGESWGSRVERDLERIAQARDEIGPDVELLVDANGAYGVAQAVRVARDMEPFDVGWFEEPVSSDDLDGLREVRAQVLPDVAAGEYGYDLSYLGRMVRARAVDCLQIDVTRCGGVSDWLRAAAVAAAANLEVSAHCAPALHAGLLLAIPNLRHQEYFHDHVRIESRFFPGSVTAQDGVLRPVPDRAGNGLVLDEDAAEPYRVG